MPRNAAKRGANGTGSIRERTRTKKDGKRTKYREARITVGFDPGTGKQIQRTVTGRTQKEVMQKLKAVTAAQDSGTYIAPNKQTLGQWLDIWEKTYLGGVKPRTRQICADNIRLHIKPALGAVRLEALNTHEIQQFYNALGEPGKTRAAGLSPKTIKDIHGVLHKALRQAVEIGRPDARFHDLRHSCVTAALRSGDDIKTVQNALGHATAAFTLDVYGHVTEEMQRESAARMDAYIKTVSQ